MYPYDKDGLLPEHMREAMERYLEHRLHPGGFLMAVLQGDLFEAAWAADDISSKKLFDYVKWLSNYAPLAAFGSSRRVHDWLYGPDDEE